MKTLHFTIGKALLRGHISLIIVKVLYQISLSFIFRYFWWHKMARDMVISQLSWKWKTYIVIVQFKRFALGVWDVPAWFIKFVVSYLSRLFLGHWTLWGSCPCSLSLLPLNGGWLLGLLLGFDYPILSNTLTNLWGSCSWVYFRGKLLLSVVGFH